MMERKIDPIPAHCTILRIEYERRRIYSNYPTSEGGLARGDTAIAHGRSHPARHQQQPSHINFHRRTASLPIQRAVADDEAARGRGPTPTEVLGRRRHLAAVVGLVTLEQRAAEGDEWRG